MIEGTEFDFDEFVNGIRENKPSNIVPLLDYLVQEYIRQIISLLMERGVKPGEKYIFDKRIADKIGLNKVFSGMTYLCSENPFDDMNYTPLEIDGKYYGIWLALNAHDCLDHENPCVLLNKETVYYAEKIYNYLIKK
ncbi:MAG: hypothetical protein PUJ90_10595 [Streptococcus suis]|nr:hypothetical protein [Streptococcus suis]